MKTTDKHGNTCEISTYTIEKVVKGKSVHYSVEQYSDGKFVDAWGFDTRSEALDYINQDSLFFIESEIKKIQIKKEKLDSEYKKHIQVGRPS